MGEAALRGANLLTTDRLRALWSRATTVQQRRRLIRAAAGLPRFDGAVLLLGWRAAASTEVQAGLDDQVRKLLAGFGVTYYTRPSPAQRAALEQARLASPLDERVAQLLEAVLA